MKPIYQDVFGKHGNCMSAAIASVLELPLIDVPNFFDFGSLEHIWWGTVRTYLGTHGYGILSVAITEEQLMRDVRGYQLVSGLSPRGNNHSVVWNSLEGGIVHDPHPEGGKVLIDTWDMIYPLDASRPLRMGDGLKYITDRAWTAETSNAGQWIREFVDVCNKARSQ